MVESRILSLVGHVYCKWIDDSRFVRSPNLPLSIDIDGGRLALAVIRTMFQRFLELFLDSCLIGAWTVVNEVERGLESEGKS